MRWCVGLTALGKVTGWYKRDFTDLEPFTQISIGGMLAILINTMANNSALLHKRRDNEYEFYYNGNLFNYSPIMYEDVAVWNADLLLFGGQSDDTSFPISMLEANANGTWILNIMENNNLSKRDGVDSDQCVNGSESIVVECQYGAGAGNTYQAVQDLVDLESVKRDYRTIMSTTYNFHHGYVGDNFRLKCTTKIYTNNQDMSCWRHWSDVWSSF